MVESNPGRSEVMGPSFDGKSVEEDKKSKVAEELGGEAVEDLKVTTAAYKGRVLLQFSEPINSVLLSRDQARDLSKALKARSIEAMRQSPN